MSDPYLPPETLDYIIDFLHDEPETLKECCLVSKSWIPRTRKHLFADIKFNSADDLEMWKKTFSDHSGSPAYHTHTLLVRRPEVVTVVEAEEGGWVRTFSQVTRLSLAVDDSLATLGDLEVTLVPFHGFSPVLKSLHLSYNILPNSRVFDLVSTFPILEDLTLVTNGPDVDGVPGFNAPPPVARPPTSPAFTGTLDLNMYRGMGSPTRQLLGLPSGLHFRKLILSRFHEEDFRWVMELVGRCSDTLECFDITCYPRAGSGPALIDLSKATRLRCIVFQPISLTVTWVIAALRTITPEHRDLRQISVHVPGYIALVDASTGLEQAVGKAVYRQWLDLDRLLVQLWESRSIRPKLVPGLPMENRKQNIACLFPEMTKRGVIDLAECCVRISEWS